LKAIYRGTCLETRTYEKKGTPVTVTSVSLGDGIVADVPGSFPEFQKVFVYGALGKFEGRSYFRDSDGVMVTPAHDETLDGLMRGHQAEYGKPGNKPVLAAS